VFSIIVVNTTGVSQAKTTTGAKREKMIPDIPALKELGIDVVYTLWIGFFTQKDTPQPIVDKLRDVVNKVAHDKQFIELVLKTGQEVEYINPADMAAHVNGELERFKKAIKEIERRDK
jgi:tripartite-type tricarboxylate transporter receptor subunit TctC